MSRCESCRWGLAPEKRFFDYVQKSEACWLWTRHKNNQGYGTFYFNGRPIYAHRFSWIIHNGDIPAGLFVCHRCDTPPCVRPDHLFLGTAADNSRDAGSKLRLPHGHGHHWAKVTTRDIREILDLYGGNIFSFMELSRLYGVSASHLARIVSGKTWKHLTQGHKARRGGMRAAEMKVNDLRQMRHHARLGLREMARLLRISSGYLSDAERGLKTITHRVKAEYVRVVQMVRGGEGR